MELPYEDEAWTELTIKDVTRQVDLVKKCQGLVPENDWHVMLARIKSECSVLELNGFLENEDRLSGYRPASTLAAQEPEPTEPTSDDKFGALLQGLMAMGVKKDVLDKLMEERETSREVKSETENSGEEIHLPLDSSRRDTLAYPTKTSLSGERQRLAADAKAWKKQVKLARALDRQITSQLRMLCSRTMGAQIDSLETVPSTACNMLKKMGAIVMRSRTKTIEKLKENLKGLKLESFNGNYDNYQTQVLNIRNEILGIDGAVVTEAAMCDLVFTSLANDPLETYSGVVSGYVGAVAEEDHCLTGKRGLLDRLKKRYDTLLAVGKVPKKAQAFGLRMKCTHCSIEGHLESNCFKKHPEKRPQGSHGGRNGGDRRSQCRKCGNSHGGRQCGFRGKCFNCGGDHAKKVCRKSEGASEQRTAKLCFGSPDDDSDSAGDDDYDFLVAQIAQRKRSTEHVAFDTAANSHVSPNRNSFKNYKAAKATDTIQGIGEVETVIAGSGVLSFGLKDQRSGEIIDLEFPRAVHLNETSQPLISAHRVHKMCTKKKWDSRSWQVYREGGLDISTPQGRFSFGMIPINGIYCFKDAYLPARNGEFNSEPGNNQSSKIVQAATTRSAAAGIAVDPKAPAEEHKDAIESESVEEHKTKTPECTRTGEANPSVALAGAYDPQGAESPRAVGQTGATDPQGVGSPFQETQTDEKAPPENKFIHPIDLQVVQDVHAAHAHCFCLRTMQELVAAGKLNVDPKTARAVKKADHLRCVHCLKGQGRNTPSSKKTSKTKLEPGEVIFMDANEGLPRSRNGNTVEFLVGDAGSGQTQPYHRKSKDEDTILEIIQHRIAYIERITGRTTKKIVFRCDWWSGQWSKKVTRWLQSIGIAHELRQAPAPGAVNHKSNGHAEVAVRLSNNGWRANRSSSGLSDYYREDISNQFWLVKNNTARKKLGWKTPQEELAGPEGRVQKLTFYSIGTRCLAKREGSMKGKGNFGKFEAVILGNCVSMKVQGMKGGYMVLNVETGKVVPRQLQPSDVFPGEFPMKSGSVTSNQGGAVSSPRERIVEEEKKPMTLRTRGGLQPLKFDQMDYDETTLKAMTAQFDERDNLYDDLRLKALRAEVLPLPKTLSKSLETEHRDIVQDSWDSELTDHFKRHSIIKRLLSEIPESAKFLPCDVLTKWKIDLDGFITRAKSRLIAKGYRQKAGIHFQEDQVSSPVANEDTHRLVLMMALLHAEELNLVDIRVAFLNAKLEDDEIMYIKPGPEWGFASDVCLELRRCIPGLKQSGHKWNKLLTATLQKLGFKPSKVDPCLFVKQDGDGPIKGVATCHVDDLLMTGTKSVIDQLRKDLGEKFEIHDIGSAEEHLGVKIEYDSVKGELKLSQRMFAEALLEEWDMEDCNPCRTPAGPVLLTAAMCPKTEKEKAKMAKVREKLHSGIMKLRWLAQKTRYDLCFAVGQLCRWTANPGEQHLLAFKRVLRYLKGSLDLKLVYKRPPKKYNDEDECINDDECVGYSDASWAEAGDGTSAGGYVFMMCGAAICAKSGQQRLVATSTAESELIQLNTTAKQGVWLRLLREQLGMDVSSPMVLMEDNAAAQRIAETGRRSKRSKHFRVREFWINEKVKDKTFIIKHCPTTEMVADIMTKPLGPAIFEKLRTMMGLVSDPV